MKTFFTVSCLLLFCVKAIGQHATPADLQLSKVENADYQIIAAPLSLPETNREAVNQPGPEENSRVIVNIGPVSSLAIPVNDNCANAITLTVDAPCTNGTNKESTIQAGENTACQGAITKSVWYRFVANSTTMYVEVERTASSGCYLSSAVYSGSCLPSASISCEDAAFGPNLNIHNLTGLTIGASYYIQVSYTAGMACGNNNLATTGADFCIKVGRPVNCGTCSTPCGPLCIFASAPTVAQVTSTCTRYDLVSRLNAGQVRTQCYTFTAVATSFSLQMIINTVGCGTGNVTTFDWQLYPSNCSGVVQSGNLTNLNATGLSIGSSYVLCYTWTAACQHNSVYPYMVATSPLPIELLHFSGNTEEKIIKLKWITASETDNRNFSVQRSENGTDFQEIGTLPGAGNSSSMHNYNFTDSSPLKGTNYYKLVQYDYNNSSTASSAIAIRFSQKFSVNIDKNPVTDLLSLNFSSDVETEVNVSILNQFGKKVLMRTRKLSEGNQEYIVPVETLSDGIYHLNIERAGESIWLKFVKIQH